MHRHIRGHLRNGGAGAGSDTGDSDGGSDGSGLQSPRKRSCAEFDDDGPPGKFARLHNESYSADDEVSLTGEEVGCPVCGTELDGVPALEIHLKEDHPDQSLTLRPSTPRRASSPQSELPSVCGSPFSVHEKGERRGAGGLISSGVHHCPTCNLPFPTVESWLLHLRDHPTLKCNICDATFDSISEYTAHQQRHSGDRLPFFEQSQQTNPPESSIFPRGLSIRVAPNQPTSFSRHNPFSVSSQLPLIRHPPITLHAPSTLSIHHSHPPSSTLSHDEQFARDYRDMKLNGQYPCRLCKEVFANLRKLKSHNLVHMVAPPYQCNLCSFVSNDKNTLKEHMKNHKGDTPYECNLCSLSFTTKANCERHIKNIHGRQTREEVKRCMTYTPLEDGPPIQEPSRDTICRLCKFDCKSRSVLRDHMRSLHPERVDKPHSCKICHVAFQSSTDAYRHIIQAHHDAASRENLKALVEQRTHKDETQPDLSSVEKLLTISNLSLPIPSNTNNKPASIPSPAPAVPSVQHPLVPGVSLNRVSTAFSSPKIIVPPPLPIPNYTPPSALPYEDTPLDLSMNKRARDDDDDDTEDNNRRELKQRHGATDDEEITVIDDDKNNKKEISTDVKSDSDVIEIKTSPNSPQSRDRSTPLPENKTAFPFMYPGQLPVQFLPFQGQYPFLMNPFGALPPVTNLQMLEQYQEIKRGLQLTSGGTLLNPDSTTNFIPSVRKNLLSAANNRLVKTDASSFPLSGMIGRSQSESVALDDGNSAEGRSQSMATDLSPSGRENEMAHFTMKNSVLVKKPKQRRYRTERPWRCDLCDKGFTLRSNMERHMKQQHPDLWQQRPRGAPSCPRLESSSAISREFFSQTTTTKSNSKSDPEEIPSETDVPKEEDESELIIDDDEEDEEGLEDSNKDRKKREENAAVDLASVQKLLSTASSQNFSFFHTKDTEVGESRNEDNSSPSLSPASQDTSSEEGKKSAYSSAPQKQKCPFCYRKFPWSSSLVRHIRTHTGQKPYLCPVCHFPFTTKSNCDRHLQRKHPDSPHAVAGDRPFRCSKCPGAAFTSVESRRKHDMFKHERNQDSASLVREDFKVFGTKAFWCYLCDMRCYSSKEMLQHVADSHPDSFRALRLRNGSNSAPSTLPSSPPAKENNNETSSDSASESASNGSEMVSFKK